MSQWTHVNCSIRFDGIPGLTPPPTLGKTVGFDDDEKEWVECDVPCGSEGSLKHELSEGHPGSATRFVASIYGDLRDYRDVSEITAYLKRIVTGQAVRSGVAEIDVEREGKILLVYDVDSMQWERVIELTKATIKQD